MNRKMIVSQQDITAGSVSLHHSNEKMRKKTVTEMTNKKHPHKSAALKNPRQIESMKSRESKVKSSQTDMHCTDCGAPIETTELTSRKIYNDAKLYEHFWRNRLNLDDFESSQKTETDQVMTSGASVERRILVKRRHC